MRGVVALVAELVDAHASGACWRTPVEVQVLFRAPLKVVLSLTVGFKPAVFLFFASSLTANIF